MIGFLIGLFVGGIIGISVMAILNIGARDDDDMEDEFPGAEF